jgi:uncharacterized RDD family membrane protein YckC
MDSHHVLGRRIVAFIIDGLIVGAINSALFFPFAERDGSTFTLEGSGAALFFLVSILVTFLYWVLLVGRTGWSVGKLAVGLRVVRSDDGTTPPGLMKAFLRYLVWIVDSFPYIIPGLTGFIVALTNPRRRRVGDMAAGTEVVKASAVGQRAQGGTGDSVGAGAGAAPPAMGTQAMPAIAPATPQPPPLPTPAAGPPADWYPDPHGEKRLRYWDGGQWTSHTAD